MSKEIFGLICKIGTFLSIIISLIGCIGQYIIKFNSDWSLYIAIIGIISTAICYLGSLICDI